MRRWANELIDLLAARAPRLDRALKKIKAAGGAYVLLDGTLVRTTRRSGPDNRPNYSGEHKSHGLLFLVLTEERGTLASISMARRGAHSEITATRHDEIEQHLKAAGLGALADPDPDPDPDPDQHAHTRTLTYMAPHQHVHDETSPMSFLAVRVGRSAVSHRSWGHR